MAKPIHLKRVRVNVVDGMMYIAANGETHEPGVRETLDGISELCQALTANGIPHETFERKKAGGGYEADTVKFHRGSL